MTNLYDFINNQIKGKYFKRKGSASEIVQINGFFASCGDRSSRAGVGVWYPLTNASGFIDSDSFEDYEPCSATEIRRVRQLAQTSPSGRESPTTRDLREFKRTMQVADIKAGRGPEGNKYLK